MKIIKREQITNKTNRKSFLFRRIYQKKKGPRKMNGVDLNI